MNTNREWLAWGRKDPMWGVASWQGKRKDDAQSWTEPDFYALGVSDWQDIHQRWTRYGFDSANVLDMGCGAGRLTGPMSQVCTKVQGLDISDAMLAYAQEHVPAENISWHQGNGLRLPFKDYELSGVMSFHVLQHLSCAEDGYGLMKESWRVLQSGGTICIHLPIYAIPGGAGGRVVDLATRAVLRASEVKSAARRLLMRFGGRPFMHVTHYDVHDVLRRLRALGFTNVEVQTVRMRSNDDDHFCFFATKP